MRKTRSAVEDRWTRADGQPTARHGSGLRWMARYVDTNGQEHSKSFDLQRDARTWLDGQVASVVDGRHVAPRDASLTVQQWCDTWLSGYAVHRASTVQQARVHLRVICAAFGDRPLGALRPTEVKAWLAALTAGGSAPSYVYALHNRLSQLCVDAIADGLLGKNPCSRRTSPKPGKQKTYVATTAQVWALVDEMPDYYRAAVLLGAFAGLRISEVAALRTTDIDWLRGIVRPQQQWPARPLKTVGSEASIPVPAELVALLSASVARYGEDYLVPRGATNGNPRAIEIAIRSARERVAGLPESFTFHDLRHYLASLLIASGADIKTVQARLRHASAKTTLDTYGHLWPDADESTRAAVAAVIRDRSKGKGRAAN
jgi:integrase